MNLIPGVQTRTTDGVIGTSGKPIRVFSIHIISGGTASVLAVYNGTGTNGTQLLSLTGTLSTGATFNFAGGFRFSAGCYLDVDSNVTSVSVSYTEEF